MRKSRSPSLVSASLAGVRPSWRRPGYHPLNPGPPAFGETFKGRADEWLTVRALCPTQRMALRH